MPYKDPAKQKAVQDRYRAQHREKILAYGREYCKRPEVKARRKEYYLEHREELLLAAKRNRMMKGYKKKNTPLSKHRKTSRENARRQRAGIVVTRSEAGFFWKAGKISNGPFAYQREAIKDAERACL